jgi:glutathione S-transferase fosA5
MITGVNHITFSVRDLDRSVSFYRDILGMRLIARWKRGAYLLAGPTWIALNVDEHAREGPSAEYSHVAFSVSPERLGPLRARIEEAGATVWQAGRDERSFYFLDPDGHRLELHTSDLTTRLEEFAADPPEGFEVLDAAG